MKSSNKFQKGSGCYKCTSCKRLTRDDGTGDSAYTFVCAQCYELGGIENAIQDGEGTEQDHERAKELTAEIIKLGGKL